MKDDRGAARAGRWVLAFAIAGAALAAGAAHTITLCVVTVALALAVGLTWWGAENTLYRPRLAATLLLVTGCVLTGYTALQVVPVPIGWLAVIAPRNADVWSRALAPLHEATPRWVPISLDPTATRVEVIKGIAYLLAYVCALRVARTRDGIAFLSTTIVVTGAVLAAAALLHPAFGVHKLYGVWEPSVEARVYGKHMAPFLNPNNLAAYLNVAFCLALAAMLSPEPRWPRPLVAAATVLLASTEAWVASRGGVASMLLGACLVVVIARWHRASRSAQPRIGSVSLIVGIAVALGGLVIVLVTSNQASGELLDTDLSKLELVRQSMRMIRSFPIFGTGRGAFESVFTGFSQTPGIWSFTNPEDVVAQWLVEWGVPLGLGGLIAVAIGLRPNTVLARSSTAAGAWAGIVAVAVQSLVDLGSEIPGLMLAPIVCAAIVVGGTAGRSTRWRVERWGQSPRMLAWTAGVVALLGTAAAAASIGDELRDDRITLHDAAMDKDTRVSAMHALARAAMLRHPAEPYLPLIVGWRAARAGDDEPVPWLASALERGREQGPAHLVLARLIARRSPSQARTEYRLAFEQAPELLPSALSETPRLVGGYDDAMELVSNGRPGRETLSALGDALAARLPATSSRLYDELAARAPSEPGPSLRSAREAIADLSDDDGAPWCEGASRDACLKRALDVSAHAEALAPLVCAGHALHAQARIAAGDETRALSELASAAQQVTDRVECLKVLEGLADRAHDDRLAMDAMTKITASGCADEHECAANLTWVAAEEARRGDGRRALVLYKRAYEQSPDNDTLLVAAAHLAASSGLHVEAEQDYERLARKHPEDVAWRKAAADERDMALNGAAAR
jgi:hypothetical protein